MNLDVIKFIYFQHEARCFQHLKWEKSLCSIHRGLWGLVVVRLLWLSGRALVAQAGGVLGLTPGDCRLFRFPLFFPYNIIYFQREARCFQHSLKGIRRPNAISGTLKGFTIPIREEACELIKHTWYCGLAQWVTILMGMVKPFSIVSYTVHWRWRNCGYVVY